MVGMFHGHAHNRKCQLHWHPMYIKGVGRTEGEGCEHIFSSSNDLARTTRHATAFHRHQSIEEHFEFWDADKYASLSNFLWNHYREALTDTNTLRTELNALKALLGLTDEDFLRFQDEERKYLDSLKQPPLSDHLSIRYIEILDEVAECHTDFDEARKVANNALTDIPCGNTNQMYMALNEVRVRVDTAYQKLQNAEAFAGHIQAQLGIEKRWEVGSAEYNRWKGEASIIKYHAALDELERLVIMRLFELSKLGLSGTGELPIFLTRQVLIYHLRVQTTTANWQGTSMTFRHYSECLNSV
ncbi:hypothetical protein BU15DRAFT_55518 [Melanogaster broomeanus]|nr:hypothetical protein BU15DRAFT_55518 [Melanogaster broomeanus]